MYATDRRLTDRHQTDRQTSDVRRQTASSLNAPAYLGRGHNKLCAYDMTITTTT